MSCPRAHHRFARGFSLVELLVSLGVSTVLMAAIGSTILLAGHSLPDAGSGLYRVLDASEALDRMSEDLNCARYLTERTATSIAAVVADRTGDGQLDTIRYSWSGLQGDPLLRQVNDQPAAPVAAGVHNFRIGYKTRTIQESYSGPGQEQSEKYLGGMSKDEERDEFEIEPDEWIGQYFRPDLPPGTLSYRLTRLTWRGKRGGNGSAIFELRPADEDGLPRSKVIQSFTISPGSLNTWTQTHTIWLSGGDAFLPDAGFVMLFKAVAADAAIVQIDEEAGSGLIQSDDPGGSWTRHDGMSLPYSVYGRVRLAGPDKSVTRSLVEAVEVQIQLGTDAASSIRTTLGLLNAPEQLSAVWETDFDADPTAADLNADEQGDWSVRGAGSFSGSSLSNGTWSASQTLDTSPSNPFDSFTTVDLRCRDTSSAAGGALFWINFDSHLGRYAPVCLTVELQTDGTQTVTLFNKTDNSTSLVLARIPGLETGMLHLRLLLDPDDDTVNLSIDGEDYGTFGYSSFVPPSADHFATIGATGSGAVFDAVSVRMGGQ